MTPADDFSRFVAGARPELLRTALLLTGDPESAEELVQRALAAVASRRHPPGTDDVLRRMIDDLAGRRLRLRPPEQIVDADPWPGTAEGRRLVDALQDLPPRTRAAAVLQWYGERDPAEAARLAGSSRGAVDAALPALVSALGRPGAAGPPAPPAEDRVGAALADLADRPVRWRLDGQIGVADARGRRRRAVLVRGGAFLAAALLVPAVATGLRAPVEAPAEPPAAATEGPGRAVAVLAGPPRGSLAGDSSFLEAVRRIGWGDVPAPQAEARRVEIATDTPHGRVVLLTGEVQGRLHGVWLTGPRGATAAELAVREADRLDVARPVVTVLGGPGPASLVVLTAPGDAVVVSDRLRVGPRGTVWRDYEPVATPADGLVVVPSLTTSGGSAASVRVLRDGQVVFRAGADTAVEPVRGPAPELRALRPAAAPDAQLVAAGLAAVGTPLGAEPADLDPELLWSAPLPRSSGSVVVLVARSPGGGLLVTTVLGTGAPGAVRAGVCGTSTPPGSTDVATLGVARTCDPMSLGLGGGHDPVLLVVTMPPAAVGADVLDRDGRVVGRLRLEEGGAVAELPEGGARVSAFDRSGLTVAAVPVAPTAAEPFGDYGDGGAS